MKADHIDALQKADAEYNEKIEKLKGLHTREMKLLKTELEEKGKTVSELSKQFAKGEKQIEVQQKEVIY